MQTFVCVCAQEGKKNSARHRGKSANLGEGGPRKPKTLGKPTQKQAIQAVLSTEVIYGFLWIGKNRDSEAYLVLP